MRIKMMLVAAAAGLLVSMSACGGGKKGGDTAGGGAPATKSLYDKLGKMDGITPVVDKFVETVILDERINSFFKNADKVHLKKMLAEQICAASGGPCKYTGKDMKVAHTGMGVKEADFTALVEDLSKTLDEFKVPQDTKDELLGALAKLKADIVTP